MRNQQDALSDAEEAELLTFSKVASLKSKREVQPRTP